MALILVSMRAEEELFKIQEIRTPGGQEVHCRWDFPKLIQVVRKVPLVFFAPSQEMRDVEGNGAGYSVRDTLSDLAAAMNYCGFATFRFAGSPELLEPANLCALYEASLAHPRISADHSVLIGLGEGADCLARDYYKFYSVQAPFAIVMLSPTTGVTGYHLNLITCPYFVVHGLLDPYFQEMPYGHLKEVVHHHQMRYGDSTTELLIPDIGRELGREGRLELRVVDEVINWLGHAAPRHQERDRSA